MPQHYPVPHAGEPGVLNILYLTMVPMWIYSLLHGWTLGRAACKLATFLLYLSLYANRYLQVLYPQMWNRLGCKEEATLLLALWGLACALTAPTIATRDMRDGERKCHVSESGDWEPWVASQVTEPIFFHWSTGR
ncbi:unnamed protein product, partial [Coregonus sp. 'balchen']